MWQNTWKSNSRVSRLVLYIEPQFGHQNYYFPGKLIIINKAPQTEERIQCRLSDAERIYDNGEIFINVHKQVPGKHY